MTKVDSEVADLETGNAGGDTTDDGMYETENLDCHCCGGCMMHCRCNEMCKWTSDKIIKMFTFIYNYAIPILIYVALNGACIALLFYSAVEIHRKDCGLLKECEGKDDPENWWRTYPDKCRPCYDYTWSIFSLTFTSIVAFVFVISALMLVGFGIFTSYHDYRLIYMRNYMFVMPICYVIMGFIPIVSGIGMSIVFAQRAEHGHYDDDMKEQLNALRYQLYIVMIHFIAPFLDLVRAGVFVLWWGCAPTRRCSAQDAS